MMPEDGLPQDQYKLDLVQMVTADLDRIRQEDRVNRMVFAIVLPCLEAASLVYGILSSHSPWRILFSMTFTALWAYLVWKQVTKKTRERREKSLRLMLPHREAQDADLSRMTGGKPSAERGLSVTDTPDE